MPAPSLKVINSFGAATGEQAEKDQGQKRETERSDNDDAPHKLQCLTN